MRFDRKLLKNLDWQLWLAMLMISAIGIVVLCSASQYHMKKQLIWVAIGNILIAASLYFDYRLLAKLVKPIYIVNLVLLLAVLVVGQEGGGAQRWISLAGFQLQPSEFAKIFIIIAFAYYLEQHGRIKDWKDLARAGAVVGVPMLLILVQPDLGTALVFVAIFGGMLFGVGTDLKYLAGLVGLGIMSIPFMWKFVMKDYQRMRLLVFLDPEAPQYRNVGGYQVTQSLIAVGSGRLFGRGFMQGTQGARNFLPAQHTDFIFSVLAEEFGFVGALVLIGLFVFMMYRMLQIALNAKDVFGSMMAIGVFVLTLFQLFINIGMTVSIMPITGIPLPLLTYGGSAYLAYCMDIALVLNVGMRRQKILF
ncbi:MAG: rod shape-determining protein RodA [Firmicutes bacterium]|nr:rod shape-determining protein RodA [Bacillota bacterium]